MIRAIIYLNLFLTANYLVGQSTSQIKQAKDIINQRGLNESQIRNEAKKRGYSDQQINAGLKKLKNDEVPSKNVGANFNAPEVLDLGKSNDLKQISNSNDQMVDKNSFQPLIGSEKVNIDGDGLEFVNDERAMNQDKLLEDANFKISDTKESNYFGYDIFKRDPALFQPTSVGAVDPDYLIGPGDELIVMMWGETQFRQVLIVDREGFIFIPEVGQVFVNGLNLNLLESKLFRVLSQSYASLNPVGRKATTFLDVSLGNLRPLRIQVVGEVAQPGAYTVSPASTLFSSLYYFNGPTNLGSLRDIHLIRDNKKISNIDFYDYLLTGKKPKDEKLQLDDVIYIPKRMKTVTIIGDVNRPAIYELKPDENILDLLEISGGLKNTAYLGRAQIDRVVPFEKRLELEMDRMYSDINLGEIIKQKTDFELYDGDEIFIFSVMDMRQNFVKIEGSISRPGSYDIGDSLRLSDLIIKADSLLGDAYLERVDIIRIKPNFEEELIKLNLSKVILGDSDQDIALQGLDRVIIYSINEMVSDKFVSIDGHVKTPGVYELKENMTVFDLIFQAGGYVDDVFIKEAYLDRAELIRENDDNKKEIINFNLEDVTKGGGIADSKLQPNDFIRIYNKNEVQGEIRFVTLLGHVKNPGRYELYEENMTIYDLIFKGGGMQDPIFKAKTLLERADLVRFNEDQITKKIITFNLGKIISDKTSKDNQLLVPGDIVRIYSMDVLNALRNVTIDGSVNNPGNYTHKTNMSLKDLIIEAGGISRDVYRYKIEIARINPLTDDDSYAESISINYNNKSLKMDADGYIGSLSELEKTKLEPYDYVSVRPDPFFSMQKKVIINGPVYYPGEYAILNPEETIYDIIERAGGLRPNAYLAGSTFIRNKQVIQIDLEKIIKKKSSKYNFAVQEEDEILISKKPNMIQILGEVSAPGFYKYMHKQRVSDAIKMAGGFSQNAKLDDIYIRLPNGVSRKYSRWISNPKVLDGSIITVGKKPIEEPFDSTEYAKELTGILANVAQAISIFILAKN